MASIFMSSFAASFREVPAGHRPWRVRPRRHRGENRCKRSADAARLPQWGTCEKHFRRRAGKIGPSVHIQDKLSERAFEPCSRRWRSSPASDWKHSSSDRARTAEPVGLRFAQSA